MQQAIIRDQWRHLQLTQPQIYQTFSITSVFTNIHLRCTMLKNIYLANLLMIGSDHSVRLPVI